MRFSEKAHIDKVGLDAFDTAVGLAMVRLKKDGRLRAAEKLRKDLAHEMAIIATGGPYRPISLTKLQDRYGAPTQEMQDIVDHYMKTTEVTVAH